MTTDREQSEGKRSVDHEVWTCLQGCTEIRVENVELDFTMGGIYCNRCGEPLGHVKKE